MTSQDTNMQVRVEAFLVDLAELTKRHGLEVGGCACDGSPWIERVDSTNQGTAEGQVADFLSYSRPTGQYTANPMG